MELKRTFTGATFRKFGLFPHPQPPQIIQPTNPNDPPNFKKRGSKSVLIIGAGLAGLSAALELSERGYKVVIEEELPFIGGKLGTKKVHTSQGDFYVEHGLHMWFYQYYMCKEILERLKVTSYLRPYNRINVMFRDYKPETIQSTPPLYPLNLLAILNRSSNLGLMDMRHLLGIIPDLMYYEHDTVYDRLDSQSFEEWAFRHGVTKKLFSVLFEPGASVTINDPKTISAAELIMWTHYFFIGHPKAMWRQIATEHHWTAILQPWLKKLEENNVTIHLEQPCTGFNLKKNRVQGDINTGDTYDWVIAACDVKGLKAIINNSQAKDAPSKQRLSALKTKMNSLKIAPPYRILRVWFDRKPHAFRSDIIETPQYRPLHLLAQFHLLEEESKAWAQKTGGSIIEFHFYADEAIAKIPEEHLWDHVRPLILEVLPELSDAKLLDKTVGTYHNFTSFDIGQGKIRPLTSFPQEIGIDNLLFAGDWVQTTYPSALMERAIATGREAANCVLLHDHVRQVPLTVASGQGPGLF
jgi:isorenieratene synthase